MNKVQIRELFHHLAEDLAAMLTILTRPDPLHPTHVRIVTSSILRKWLIDKWINELERYANCKFSFPILNNTEIFNCLKNPAEIPFFLTGGISLAERVIQGVYVSNQEWTGQPAVLYDKMHKIDVTCKEFLKQKRIYFNGENFTTEQIIRHMSNKTGGIHYDLSRKYFYEEKLDEAALYLEIGNPKYSKQPIDGNDDPNKAYIGIEFDTPYTWNCLHIEMLAAAQSLVNIKINNESFLIFDEKNQEVSYNN